MPAALTLEIDGAPQPALDAGLVAARIEHGLDHAAEAVLVFHLPMPLDGAPAAAVFATVRPGPSVQLLSGPGSPALFSGEIVAVTQDLRADRPPRLELVARDHLAALGHTALTMAYLEQTPLDIIGAVAARHRLQVASEIDGGALR